MRTITPTQRQTLNDLSAEGLLGGLPLQIAEKDIHVTDLLYELSRLEIRHEHFLALGKGETAVDDGIKLVFAGGTCLSKAHQLIGRMSEDVDVKVILNEPSRKLKEGVGARARLGALHTAIEAMLVESKFHVPGDIEGRENPQVRDSRRYFVVGARYQTEDDTLSMLRPELKLELINRHPRLPCEPMSFGYMYEALAKVAPSRPVTFPCIDVAETLAEKVLSLLRRCRWKWSGLQQGDMDPALVRHVYDVYRIMQKQPQQLDKARTIFNALVAGDAEEFKNRDADFEKSPRKTLTATLEQCKDSTELMERYATKLQPLIFDDAENVDYATALSAFENAAHELIAQLK